MNAIEKAQNAVVTVKKRSVKKVLAAICSASIAMSTVAINAFAAEGTGVSTDMYQTIADAFKDGASGLSVGIALILGGVVPIAVGIVGLYAAIGAGKKILTKLTT